jgi:alkanesulfonate monooxygenase SsuD/methylene tetrahydromethanopterin reductase-like flavin-dependent oxidoreductase (luciferase family)
VILRSRDVLAFGVFDHLDSSGLPLAEFYENRLKLTEAYDRLGFYGYHVAEHHATPLGMAPSPGIFLAAVAQRTRRLNFGPLVYTLPLYPPLRLIEEICMLDQISGGRFQLGVGRGISPIETRHCGVDPDAAPKMFAEAFEVILRGLQSRVLDFRGEYYRFDHVPLELEPWQKPHPPLWYGASTPASVERPASIGASIVTNANAVAARALFERYAALRAAAGAGGEPKLGIARHVVVADTDEVALTLARPAYRRWHASFLKLWLDHGTRPVNVVYPAEFDGDGHDGRMIAGSPATVRDALQAQIDQCGANYVLTRFAFGDIALADAERSVALFAEQVMPRLRAKQPAAV